MSIPSQVTTTITLSQAVEALKIPCTKDHAHNEGEIVPDSDDAQPAPSRPPSKTTSRGTPAHSSLAKSAKSSTPLSLKIKPEPVSTKRERVSVKRELDSIKREPGVKYLPQYLEDDEDDKDGHKVAEMLSAPDDTNNND